MNGTQLMTLTTKMQKVHKNDDQEVCDTHPSTLLYLYAVSII